MSGHRRNPESSVDPRRLVRDKNIRKLIETLTEQGWTFVRLSSSKHPIMRWPETGGQMTLPSTPSDHRALLNAVSTARKISGLDPRIHRG